VKPVSYTNWGPGEPSGYGYGYLNYNGRWYNTSDTGLGTGGWGVIEIDDVGADGDADGLAGPPGSVSRERGERLRSARSRGGRQFRHRRRRALHAASDRLQRHRGIACGSTKAQLGAGNYRFSATPTIKDPAGNALDGNGDGSGGDTYERFFTIAPPTGYQIEHSGFGPQAPLLELTEDPVGSGLAIGRALGRLDPAYGSDYSDLDQWRIELEKG
jgi:hypothetical protein